VVTYKCQKLFLRRLGTNKCQSKLIGDKELNKFTSESQNQELARKLSQIVAVCWGCNMDVPVSLFCFVLFLCFVLGRLNVKKIPDLQIVCY
jgi:hypothetical protein